MRATRGPATIDWKFAVDGRSSFLLVLCCSDGRAPTYCGGSRSCSIDQLTVGPTDGVLKRRNQPAPVVGGQHPLRRLPLLRDTSLRQ